MDVEVRVERWVDEFLELFHEGLLGVGEGDVVIVFLLEWGWDQDAVEFLFAFEGGLGLEHR